MPQHIFEDPTRFQPQFKALEEHKDIFQSTWNTGRRKKQSAGYGDAGAGQATRRRIRSRLSRWWKRMAFSSGATFPASGSSLLAGARAPVYPQPLRTLVLAKQFPVPKPNKVAAGMAPSTSISTHRSRGHSARDCGRCARNPTINLFSTQTDIAGPFSGRTLVFVHGTFSNADNMLAEFAATSHGKAFLNAADDGEKKYDNIVFFEHATLAVSPVINALELGRFMAGSSGQIDVVAHSRGGLIVRWWLEAFGKSL